jgi:hypothetical protein
VPRWHEEVVAGEAGHQRCEDASVRAGEPRREDHGPDVDEEGHLIVDQWVDGPTQERGHRDDGERKQVAGDPMTGHRKLKHGVDGNLHGSPAVPDPTVTCKGETQDSLSQISPCAMQGARPANAQR